MILGLFFGGILLLLAFLTLWALVKGADREDDEE